MQMENKFNLKNYKSLLDYYRPIHENALINSQINAY